jgi:hypothetical protein
MRGDHVRSEVLYRKLLEQEGLTSWERALVWERYTLSAVSNEHYHLALEALPRWDEEDPQAPESRSWQQAWLTVLKNLDNRDVAAGYMQRIASSDHYPWLLRGEAGLLLAQYHWQQAQPAEAMQVLDMVYAQAAQELPEARAEAYQKDLERALLRELSGLDDQTLASLAGLVEPDNRLRFPYAVVLLEHARRLAREEGQWPKAWQTLRQVQSQSGLRHQELIASVIDPLVEELGQPMQGIALALPLSGPYGGVGWKILRGAGLAQWELLQAGADMDIEVVNTEAEDFAAQMAALPPGYNVVGGPLRLGPFRAMQELAQANATQQRVNFAFMPGLGEAQEGQDAWRFFSSSQDQVRAMVELAVEELGIYDLAVLYPDEPFGRRMGELFLDEALYRGAQVTDMLSYPPDKPQEWGRAVFQLLDVDPEEEARDDPLPPEPAFQAVFLPDGWSQAQMLVPQFLFYQEDRLLVMGSALWSQALSDRRDVDTRNFRLAVFPGAWNPHADSPAVERLRDSLEEQALPPADFWVALGYDFVRFAARFTPLPAGWDVDAVNERLALLSQEPMQWSLAPLSWDFQGKVSQDMFVFRPSASGLVPSNTELLAKRLEMVREQHQERVESIKEKREQEALEQQGAQNAPSTAPGPQ